MSIKIEGIDKLVGELKENVTLNDVKRVVHKRGGDLKRQMAAQTVQAYVKGYSVGDTAKNLILTFEKDGMSAVVKSPMEYSPYVEYGTRYMEAEPIVEPSLDVVGAQFINDLQRLSK